MEARINDIVFRYPDSPDELLLGEWIDFMRAYGADLDARAAEVEALEGISRQLAAIELVTERAFAVIAHFSGVELAEAKRIYPAPVTLRLYRGYFSRCFAVPPGELELLWRGRIYTLPPPELSQASPMTFGEVVDAKAMQQNAVTLEWSRWELIQMLCSIFFRPRGEEYTEELAYIGGERSQAMEMLPIRGAIIVSEWFTELNRFLEECFTVFQESSLKSGNFMRKHFAAWGWVNFLKSIAKTKVFDIPGNGLHSIECARRAKAYDVLMYASEEKEFSEALSADMDAKTPR